VNDSVRGFLQALSAGSIAVSTALAALGVGLALLLNPLWVGFEQDRSGAAALSGYSPQQVREVTGSILSDLVFGPPDFDVTAGGAPVLTPPERSHMADVRGTFGLVGLAVAAGWIVLIGACLLSRGSRRFWLAVRAGGLLVAGGVVVLGAFSVLFFDQAFEVMHRIFFPVGTYSFDPNTSRLVQLFPDQFWFETSIVLGTAILGLGVLAAFVGGRLARGRAVGQGGPPEGRP
jgi:integral membrane protein (TIGR01906 family)